MKIQLIPINVDYAELFLEWRSQPSWVEHNPLKSLDLEGIRAMLALEGSDFFDLKKFENYRWAISSEGMVVGHVLLKNLNHMMGQGEIGYGVSEAYQGRGLATLAVAQFVTKTFRETTLRKLIAIVHEKNESSCKLLDRIGFKREGLLREHHLINGLPTNQVLFGLLRKDLEAKHL